MSTTDKQKDAKKRSIGKYNIYETLGKGGYSWVKKGEDTETKAIVALKFMNRATDQWALEQAEQVRTEIKSLTQIRHEHVMKLYAYNLSAKYPLNEGGHVKTILLVLEYCPGGELFDILYYADKLEEEIARTYFQQMCTGVDAIHSAGIAHRDLKPQNLLLDSNFNLKITDFGLSKIIESEEDRIMKTTYVGTRGYQAPELLKNQKYTNACDIFSMGVILFILLAGYPPFEAAHKTDKWYRPLATGDLKKFWHVHRGAKICEEAKELIQSMLSYRPSKRATLSDIMKHKWYSGPTVKKNTLKEKVLSRFLQARENRKKDVKKAKDLVDSNHLPDDKRRKTDVKVDKDENNKLKIEVNYDDELEKKIAPSAAQEIMQSMRSFYTHRTAMNAIQVISKVLKEKCMCKVDYDVKLRPFELKCKVGAKEHDDKTAFEFRVNAYVAKNSLYNVINIKPVYIPDRMMWHRVMRDMLETMSRYDILMSDSQPVPLLEVNAKGELVNNDVVGHHTLPAAPTTPSISEDDKKDYENDLDEATQKKEQVKATTEAPAPMRGKITDTDINYATDKHLTAEAVIPGSEDDKKPIAEVAG